MLYLRFVEFALNSPADYFILFVIRSCVPALLSRSCSVALNFRFHFPPALPSVLALFQRFHLLRGCLQATRVCGRWRRL
jgi:hypothetical protein